MNLKLLIEDLSAYRWKMHHEVGINLMKTSDSRMKTKRIIRSQWG